MLATVTLNSSNGSYDIIIKPGLLREIGGEISARTRSRKVAVVTDSIVGPLYVHHIEASLRESAINVITAMVPAGESHKTFTTVESIYDVLLPAHVDRATPILALGGGVIGDTAGFAAATILRGVPFIQVPTSLLGAIAPRPGRP